MDALDDLIGENPKIVALRQKARALLQRHQTARRIPPVLIQGETGTGKGLLARLMHRAGQRASAPFVDLNCAAIPETLLEAELFGYERGAFTDARQSKPGLFHVAHGGTLFLDEIGLLPRGLQAKLLTVLEQGSVRRLGGTKNEPANVSIIAATNESLQSAVWEGRFREDLYHRLAVLTLELPPLRERRDDIELLAGRLLGHVCAEYDLPAKMLTEDGRTALRTYEWPGNVRELSNVIERAVLLADTETITANGLDLPGRSPDERRHAAAPPPTLEDTYRHRLVDALERTAWNITRTAAMLGITRNTVRARMHLYGLRPAGTAPAPAASPPAPAASDVTPPFTERAELATIADVRWERRRLTFLRARVLSAVDTPSSVTTRVLGWLIDKGQTFGGHVTEINRDGVVVVFGHEPAEDAPRRAATTALAVTKLVAREHLHGDLPSAVSVTLAIHVDRVALARIGGRPVIEQDAVRRTAAALDELEPIGTGEIGVSETAVKFLLRHFDVKQPPNARAGGHHLVGRWGTPGGAHPVVFIGRRPEIDLLHGLLDRAMLGQGQIVTLVGEPGIGKSRLLYEFQQSAQTEGVITCVGHCASYATHVPYVPAIEILLVFRIAWPRCTFSDTSEQILTLRHDLWRHMEMEVFVPAKHIREALDLARYVTDAFAGRVSGAPIDPLLRQLVDQRMDGVRTYTHHYPISCRRVERDETLVSMTAGGTAYGGGDADGHYYTMSFFNYGRRRARFAAYCAVLARLLIDRYRARLHWGKFIPEECRPLLRKTHSPSAFSVFERVCAEHDPAGTFRNRYAREVLGLP